jgi:cytochrome c oxidase cbb3-type subunit 4
MSSALFDSIFTVFSFVLFVGILWWTYRRANKKGYDEAARLPFEEEDAGSKPLNGDKK